MLPPKFILFLLFIYFILIINIAHNPTYYSTVISELHHNLLVVNKQATFLYEVSEKVSENYIIH